MNKYILIILEKSLRSRKHGTLNFWKLGDLAQSPSFEINFVQSINHKKDWHTRKFLGTKKPDSPLPPERPSWWGNLLSLFTIHPRGHSLFYVTKETRTLGTGVSDYGQISSSFMHVSFYKLPVSRHLRKKWNSGIKPSDCHQQSVLQWYSVHFYLQPSLEKYLD